MVASGAGAAKPKLLVFGVDAGSPALFERWCDSGDMPNLAQLMCSGAWRHVQNPYGLEAGSVWPVFQSGLLPGRQPQYDGRRAFVASTYSSRWYQPGETPDTLWRQLSDQGLRCLLVDPPYTHIDKAINGTMVVDWGGHVPANGHDFDFQAHPAGIADEIRRLVGEDPLGGVMCDRMGPETVADHERFRDLYIQRIGQKAELAIHLMQTTTWDVGFIGSSDLHCTGHHLWHVNDPQHPQYSAALEAALGEPIKDCYRAFDRSLGKMLAAMPAETTVMLFGSHGMGPSYSGTGLLDRILQRIDAGRPAASRRTLKGNIRALWHRVPKQLRGKVKSLRKPFRGMLRPAPFVGDRQGRRYFEVFANNATGGIRLNIEGREGHGLVARSDVAAIIQQLKAELFDIINEETGEPLVEDVVISGERYPGPYEDALPDLLVLWNRSGPIRTVSSPAIGRLSQQYPDNRTGDHTPDGLMVLAGPTIAAVGELPLIRTEDIAPSIAHFFGLALSDSDGEVFELTPAETLSVAL